MLRVLNGVDWVRMQTERAERVRLYEMGYRRWKPSPLEETITVARIA